MSAYWQECFEFPHRVPEMASHGPAVPEDPLANGRGYMLEVKIKMSNLKHVKSETFCLGTVNSPNNKMAPTTDTGKASTENRASCIRPRFVFPTSQIIDFTVLGLWSLLDAGRLTTDGEVT